MQVSLKFVNGRDWSWIVAANETIPLASGGPERMDVSKMDWGTACHAAARRGMLRRTHPVLAKKCSALDGMEHEGNACFEWGTAAKDKMDAEGRLVVGELAAGASSRWAGDIDIG
jgi:hypothetical protein